MTKREARAHFSAMLEIANVCSRHIGKPMKIKIKKDRIVVQVKRV